MGKGMTIDQFSPGLTYSYSKVVTEEMIAHFAEATGDDNPVHLDEEFAETSIFKKRVAHGMLTAGILSGVFGTQFPGQGTIYISQTLKFLRPVFIGDEITVSLEVLEADTEKNRLKLNTTCLNQDGKKVLVGQAVVMPPA
jgi:3-hydroxybutyryl-CoA dehydratase